MLALALALVFGISGPSFAATVVLTDADMAGVSAGEWVVLTDSSGNETVEDVYTNNNTLWLLANSQESIQAVSNANAIDSAVAVQTNVASVTDPNPPTQNVAIDQSNQIDVVNYRPASSKLKDSSSTETTTSTQSSSSSGSTSNVRTEGRSLAESSGSSTGSSSTEYEYYEEDLDIDYAAASQSSKICKDCIEHSNSIAILTVDYDKDIKTESSSTETGSETSSKTELVNISDVATTETNSTSSSSSSNTKSSTEHCESRDSKGANNHILLDETSQQNIQAVSNLNAVASGVAIQTNVASNVGVNGSITQSNAGSVQSGF